MIFSARHQLEKDYVAWLEKSRAEGSNVGDCAFNVITFLSGAKHLAADLHQDILDALGCQGGTVADALAEVRRLRAKAEDPFKGLALNQALADWWPLDRPVRLDDMERLEGVLRDLFEVPPKPLGQGVAALLPEHGEVKP